MAPNPMTGPQSPEDKILALKSQLALCDKDAEQREQMIENLRTFVNNVFILLDCQTDDLDDGICELRKLIEKTHKLTSILTEIHEANCNIPFSIYAKHI